MLAAHTLDDPRLEAAFANVRREDFLGPGPWQLFTRGDGYRPTPDDDPVHLYQDIGVEIIPERGLNNGVPQFLAYLIHLGKLKDGEHAVHVGAGVGYYTAIMARLVGPKGKITAIEYVPELATRAIANLAGELPCARDARRRLGDRHSSLPTSSTSMPAPRSRQTIGWMR